MIIAADPGKKGALCALYNDGRIFKVMVMPMAGKDIDWGKVTDFIRECVTNANGEAVTGVIEKVHAMPGQGVTSMFSFGGSFHGLRAVYAALRVSYELVSPQGWKKVVLAGTQKDKAAATAYCRQKWPRQSLMANDRCRTVHDGITDVLCIAEFGRRTYAPATPTTEPGDKAPRQGELF